MTEDNNPPSRVGEILNNLLSQLGFESKIREMKVLKSWQEVVGKGISKHSQPVKISKGNLLVKVDSSAWINELCHLKDKIIEKFNKLHKNEVIKDIHFRLGKIAPSFSRVRRGRRRARNINLNEEELDWVEKTVGKLKDENLKEAVKRALIEYRKSKKIKGKEKNGKDKKTRHRSSREGGENTC